MKNLKRSVKVKQVKDSQRLVKEIKDIVKQASINYGFLTSILVEGDAEATYHNIMDYRESVDKMIQEFNELN
ncbi:MAG: hypothetical protein ACK5XN_02750 [Bacteroidota bacterium]|jgi:hypothetical protein